DPDVPGDWGGTALRHAAWNGHARIVQLLLSRRADPMTRQHWGGDALRTAIHGASHARHKNGAIVAALLVKAMRNVDLAPYIEDARREGAADVAALLAYAAANRDSGAKASDWKPLMDAAFYGRAEQVRKLLAAGANPNVL